MISKSGYCLLAEVSLEQGMTFLSWSHNVVKYRSMRIVPKWSGDWSEQSKKVSLKALKRQVEPLL